MSDFINEIGSIAGKIKIQSKENEHRHERWYIREQCMNPHLMGRSGRPGYSDEHRNPYHDDQIEYLIKPGLSALSVLQISLLNSVPPQLPV